MISVTKEFAMECCHHLEGYNGACSRPHGHSYKLFVEVSGEINKQTGMLMDFSLLKRIVNDLIIEKYDHRNLDDFYPMSTAEIMVMDFANILLLPLLNLGVNLESIRLYETATSYATWRR